MKLSIQSKNPNYLAKVVKLPELRAHPNADKLAVVTIDGQNVITGKDAEAGALYIYFPLECKINGGYLSFSNSYSDGDLNRDKTVKSFFQKQGRVKTIRLRGMISEGYVAPVKTVEEWMGVKFDESMTGTEFDTIDGTLFVEKYVLVKKETQDAGARKKQGQVKRESKLVDNQFRLHVETAQLKKNIHNINPDDYISISEKYHGTSFVAGKVLCKKPLKWYEKCLMTLGVNIVNTHYDLVFSSRKVIKNAYADQKTQDFYDSNVWESVAKKLEPFMKDGISFYGEIVGQTKSGGWIQKEYDYGTQPLCNDYLIYRITYTNASGDVFEFSVPQLIAYCEKYGLNKPIYHFYGKAKDLFPEITTTEDWHENLLEKMIPKYAEGDCFLCSNKVPREGVVIRKEGDSFEAFKLKSLAFLKKETDDLDNGVVDMESAQSEE